MSIGLKGKITREQMIHYSVAATIWVTGKGRRNTHRAACKICGESLDGGQGIPASIQELEGPNSTSCYLCDGCVQWVSDHRRQWISYAAVRKREQETSQERKRGSHEQE